MTRNQPNYVELNRAAVSVEPLLHDLPLLEMHVLQNVHPGGHPGGTCKIGSARSADTVVDERCRVVGVDGLRVVDASIFPSLMRAGLNLPVMMAAEKAAVMMEDDLRR
jgi:5-(hydroxymethyl)furfural/furfural oxidase